MEGRTRLILTHPNRCGRLLRHTTTEAPMGARTADACFTAPIGRDDHLPFATTSLG